MGGQMKKCPKCGEIKSKTEFCYCNNKLTYWCKKCNDLVLFKFLMTLCPKQKIKFKELENERSE